MKKHLLSTFSITLLLSTPYALHTIPGDPYEQQAAVNKEITVLATMIENLKKQRDAIPTQKNELTLVASNQKGTDQALLIKTGQEINDLNLLAANTAQLIQEKEKELKNTQAKLPALAARIKTLEPSANLETLQKYRTNLAGIQKWNTSDFTYCETTYIPSKEDKKVKISQPTIKKSDKSAPMLPTQEEYTKIVEERKNQPMGWGSYFLSYLYTKKVVTTAQTSDNK